MHPERRRIIIPIVVILLLVAGLTWWRSSRVTAGGNPLSGQGTIEVRPVSVATEFGGRVVTVEAEEGAPVVRGQPLVILDGEMLAAQRQQAEAALRAARAQHAAARAGIIAAEASYELLQAGASDEQLAVARSAVARAAATVEAAESALTALPEGSEASVQAEALRRQVEVAVATLDNAEAQLAQAEAGPRPQDLAAAKARVDAARSQAEAVSSQVDAAQAALDLLDLQQERLTVRSPMDGLLVSRAIEPGELALPGVRLLEVARMDPLSLTIYISEEQYGRIWIGDSATVTVDSYPGERFPATVRRIADQAEFTPRNTQTDEGRRLTVFAIELTLPNPEGKLKAGMPAEVLFEE